MYFQVLCTLTALKQRRWVLLFLQLKFLTNPLHQYCKTWPLFWSKIPTTSHYFIPTVHVTLIIIWSSTQLAILRLHNYNVPNTYRRTLIHTHICTLMVIDNIIQLSFCIELTYISSELRNGLSSTLPLLTYSLTSYGLTDG